MKKLLAIVLLFAGSLLAGCTSAPVAPPPSVEDLFVDAAFAPPSQPVDASQVFALSPAMKQYLEVEIAPLLRREGRHRGLVEALVSRTHLSLAYDTESTRNAAEAFDARSGNCLSLVVMTAALAKSLELPIQFQVLTGQESWSRSGSLAFVNGHVNIAVGARLIDRVNGTTTDSDIRVDYGSLATGRGAALRVVSEATIVAMFMNNRAAESLVLGDIAQAYAYARETARSDPLYTGGLNTLGVIYRRQGLPDAAERVWRRALAIDENHGPTLSNLALLLESRGRAAEAAQLQQRLARLEAEPPFQQFDLGREALARGEYAQARDHLQRALRRNPEYHEFHYWLALALAGLGDARGASEHLQAAVSNSTTRRDHDLYASKLDRLKASAAAISTSRTGQRVN
jgi:Tfp pilus assembly protein PilF